MTFPIKKSKSSTTVRIKMSLKRAIEEFIETETATKYGYEKKSEVVNAAVRALLLKHGFAIDDLVGEENFE